MGYYDHPTRGRLQTYMFENNRNTRLYYDASEQDWNRMPLYWECNVPEVRQMLELIDQALPSWRNVNEQLLVLRECNYVVEVSASTHTELSLYEQDAILFAEINFRDLKQKDVKASVDGPMTGFHRQATKSSSLHNMMMRIHPRQRLIRHPTTRKHRVRFPSAQHRASTSWR